MNDEIDEILKIKNFKGIKIRHLLSHVSGLRLSLGSLKEKSKEEMEKIILSAGPTTKPAEAIWYTDQGYYLLGKIGEGLVDKDLINESKKCPCPKARNETRAGCCYTLGGWRINDYRITGKEVPEGILSLTGFTGPTLMIDYSTKLVVTIMHSSLHPKRKDEEETKLKNKYHALITEEIYKNLQ